jgi:protein CpxP
MGMRGKMDPAKMEAMMTKRLADLKAKLKITGEQEAAWTSFTTAMKPPVAHGSQASRPRRDG